MSQINEAMQMMPIKIEVDRFSEAKKRQIKTRIAIQYARRELEQARRRRELKKKMVA
jgi:hypothetical protein